MAGSPEDEIYSTMFSSLKHPVRRKILRMLGNKPMTFMEMVEELGVSTPHLTYHLDSLGELVSKLDNGQYKLSAFGLATVGAMKGVEEVREIEPKRRVVSFRWKAVVGALLIAVVLLAGFSAFQYNSLNQTSSLQKLTAAENLQLLSWGIGADKVANFLKNITQVQTDNYTISLLSDTLRWRTDFGGVSEEELTYSLKSDISNLNPYLRFRNNHFSRYDINMIESSPIFTQIQPNDVLQNARFILARYKTYSGDSYLTSMTNLINSIYNASNIEVTQGNMKLQITNSAGTTGFLWCYTDNGIDYQAKGLQMTFQNNVLTTMTDGYFLFNIGSTGLNTSNQTAVSIARNYVKTFSYSINGQQVSGFNVQDTPLSVQLVPHNRVGTVTLVPYWYIEMRLTTTYAGGINEVTVGIYADNGQVSDVQMLSGSTGT
jgi:DNA-binding transcriptional ArsR family regulator